MEDKEINQNGVLWTSRRSGAYEARAKVGFHRESHAALSSRCFGILIDEASLTELGRLQINLVFRSPLLRYPLHLDFHILCSLRGRYFHRYQSACVFSLGQPDQAQDSIRYIKVDFCWLYPLLFRPPDISMDSSHSCDQVGWCCRELS